MLKRAGKTFIQAAIGYVTANLAISVTGICDGKTTLKDTLIAFFASAVACGLAAVMNLPKKGGKAEDDVLSDADGGDVADMPEEKIPENEASTGDESDESAATEEDGLEHYKEDTVI